jgi:uncharacterized membrane protein YjjP (DUF1212 family)
VLVGLRAVTVGSSPYKALNVGYHEVMLSAVVAGLILLLIPGVRATLARAMNGRVVKVTHG